MADNDSPDPEDFEELLRQLFGSGMGAIDPEQLQRLTGGAVDPAMLQQMMSSFQGMFSGMAGAAGDTDDGTVINWETAQRQALHIANQSGLGITTGQRTDLDQAFVLANLWLSDATTIAELTQPAKTLTRGEWVEHTMPVWQELAEPFAATMTNSFMSTLDEQVPEEMKGMIAGAGRLMRSLGGAAYSTQLGQIIGRLSTEVVAGGDVGFPLLPSGEAAILPQNFADFKSGLEVADDQLALYLGTRELAHARLFRHAKWLRLHVISQIIEFTRGVAIDTERVEEAAREFDPEHPERLGEILQNGSFLKPESAEQKAARSRLENLIATVEGWVDVVTTDATARLPEAVRISEAVRRRRAVGNPAEKALGSLMQLELRPRRLREAAAMWRAVTDAVGIAARDALWDYPDFMPTAEDIDDPAALIARLQANARGDEPVRDEMDDALAKLLAGDETRLIEGEDGTITPRETEPPADEDGSAEPPTGPHPV
ncbi:zinc-dependent metalloprotease [Microbacterium sp. YY-03]|uniref:zinc-dependent metalloprotease n=1 Tax=Microbacterium sp. YY-03 TaxID=3421636 RepID=UPI003D170725